MAKEHIFTFNLDLSLENESKQEKNSNSQPRFAPTQNRSFSAAQQENVESPQKRVTSQLKIALETGDAALLAEVIDGYSQWLSLEPEQFEPYMVLGYLALETEQYTHAERLLSFAIRLEPFNKRAQKLLRAAKAKKALTKFNV